MQYGKLELIWNDCAERDTFALFDVLRTFPVFLAIIHVCTGSLSNTLLAATPWLFTLAI